MLDSRIFLKPHVCIRSIFSPLLGLNDEGLLKQPCKTQGVIICTGLHKRLQSPESVQMDFVDIKCLCKSISFGTCCTCAVCSIHCIYDVNKQNYDAVVTF